VEESEKADLATELDVRIGRKKGTKTVPKHPISERINDVAESYWRSRKLALRRFLLRIHEPVLGLKKQYEVRNGKTVWRYVSEWFE
jgi:hypothetical protein